MCCVVGYIGKGHSWAPVVEGLARLEYRGYDSTGFACLDAESAILAVKAVGGVDNLVEQRAHLPIDGRLGIGHTRWSTHGAATVENAHPVFDCARSVAIVHNGIIENHRALRDQLVNKGHAMATETDSEVIAHLIEQEAAQARDMHDLAQRVVARLEGAYAFVALVAAEPQALLAVRKSSPLCIGLGPEGLFVASDQLAFVGKADRVVFLPDASYAILYHDRFEAYTFLGQKLELSVSPLSAALLADDKKGYAHFMLKEIYEQPRVIADTVTNMRLVEHVLEASLGLSSDQLDKLEQLLIIGCGSSWHAGKLGQFFFEAIAQVPVVVGLASEYKYAQFFMPRSALALAISQSGETADTLEVMRLLHGHAVPTATVTNVGSSSMARETGGVVLLAAGQEIAVASTKAFSAQVATLFLLAHQFAWRRNRLARTELDAAYAHLLVAGHELERTIEHYKVEIEEEIAPLCATFTRAIFLGRHTSYVVAQEAALKLKEITYIFAEAFPAGELKHGPIALVDKNTPIFIFSVIDEAIYKKLVANAQEVKARGGYLIIFAFAGQDELIELADKLFVFDRVHPLLGALAQIGVVQYLVYCIARELKLPIDKPRNLAKSVTVE